MSITFVLVCGIIFEIEEFIIDGIIAHKAFGYGAKVDLTMLNYVGKTDIDCNKIYADSSIVEWTSIVWDDCGNRIFNGKYIGYFHFDNKELCYQLKDNSSVSYEFCNEEMVNFKITGTLQENKELLI